MIRFLSTVLLAMFAASGAYAQANSLGSTVQKRSDGYTVDLPSYKAAGTYLIGPAFPKAVIGFDLGSAFAGTLYACETTTYAAGTCTAFGTAIDADINSAEFNTTRRYYLLTITTPETGSNVSRLTIFGTFNLGGGGGVLGSGPLSEMLAATAEAGDLWQQTDDDGTADCATGSGAGAALLCQYDGASWIPAGIAGGTDNLGNHTATTAITTAANADLELTPNGTGVVLLGKDLDADGNAITGVGTLQVDDQPIYYVESYYTSNWLTAINDALAACDAAAEVDTNLGKPGIVMLPRGRTVITVTGANTSPLIQLPEVGNDSDDNRYASCELRGWGAVPNQLFGNNKAASFLYFYNPDSMVDDAGGRNVLLLATGYGQVIKDFVLGISGDADTDTDDTTGILLQSTARGAYALGEAGIKDWEISQVHMKSARARTGTAVEMIFALNGRLVNNDINTWETGLLLTTQSGTANNANLVQGNRLSGNTVGIDIPGVLSCQDFYLNGANTIESNTYGIRLRADSTCRVYSFGTHWEQDYTSTPAGVNDVLIESANPHFFSFGDFWDSVFNANAATSALDHIERTVANAATNSPDMVLGGAFRGNEDLIYTYAAGGRIIVNENYTNATLGLPRASDCSASPHSTNGNVCVDSDDESLWVSGAQITGGGSGDITAVSGYTSGAAFTDGVASTGAAVLIMEGTTVDTAEFTISLQDADPSADILWYQPDAATVLTFPTGTRTLATLDGTETFTNKTVGGVTDTNLVDKAAAETISGAWDWTDTGTFDFGGPVTATSFTADPTASPTLTLDDSDSASESSDAVIAAQATDTGAGTEDVDVTISTQVNSTLTARITIDADGSTTIPSLAATNAVLTTPNIGAATGTSLDLGTGTIRGGVCTEYATAATIASGFAAGDMEGCWYFITSGTDTIVLPAITADGQSACFYAVGANVITLDPNASDQIRRSDGTLQTAGVTITSPATAGSFGCFISVNSSGADDEWVLLGANGTWAVGS